MFSHIWGYLGRFLKNQNLNWKANGHIGGQTNNFLKIWMLLFSGGGGLLFSYFCFFVSPLLPFDVLQSSSNILSYVSRLQTNKKDKKTKKTRKKGKKENNEKHRKRSQTETKEKVEKIIKIEIKIT